MPLENRKKMKRKKTGKSINEKNLENRKKVNR